jgi:nucleoside-diphosphate-sugar epimerase
MKILVTGSRGYAGIGVVPALVDQGHEVIGLDVSPLPEGYAPQANYREVVGSITDSALLAELVPGCGAIVHAALGHFQVMPERKPGQPVQRQAIDAYDVTVEGTIQLLEAMRKYNVRQMVLFSTAAVVLDHVGGPHNAVYEVRLDAQTPPKHHSFYGLAKQFQEQVAEFYARAYGLSVITFRIWVVVDGPRHLTKYGTPLEAMEFFFSPTGMVDRYDLGLACHMALQRPDITYDVFYPVAGPEPERYFDVEHLRKELRWHPRYTFAHLVRGKGVRQRERPVR